MHGNRDLGEHTSKHKNYAGGLWVRIVVLVLIASGFAYGYWRFADDFRTNTSIASAPASVRGQQGQTNVFSGQAAQTGSPASEDGASADQRATGAVNNPPPG